MYLLRIYNDIIWKLSFIFVVLFFWVEKIVSYMYSYYYNYYYYYIWSFDYYNVSTLHMVFSFLRSRWSWLGSLLEFFNFSPASFLQQPSKVVSMYSYYYNYSALHMMTLYHIWLLFSLLFSTLLERGIIESLSIVLI